MEASRKLLVIRQITYTEGLNVVIIVVCLKGVRDHAEGLNVVIIVVMVSEITNLRVDYLTKHSSVDTFAIPH